MFALPTTESVLTVRRPRNRTGQSYYELRCLSTPNPIGSFPRFVDRPLYGHGESTVLWISLLIRLGLKASLKNSRKKTKFNFLI